MKDEPEPRGNQRDQLITEMLQRSFRDKASEDVPDNFLKLIEQLRQQEDGANEG